FEAEGRGFDSLRARHFSGNYGRSSCPTVPHSASTCGQKWQRHSKVTPTLSIAMAGPSSREQGIDADALLAELTAAPPIRGRRQGRRTGPQSDRTARDNEPPR